MIRPNIVSMIPTTVMMLTVVAISKPPDIFSVTHAFLFISNVMLAYNITVPAITPNAPYTRILHCKIVRHSDCFFKRSINEPIPSMGI